MAQRRRREYRIWKGGLADAEGRLRSAEEVIAEIIGTTRPTLRCSELEVILCCSSQLIKALHESGELLGALVGHTRHLRRDSLAAFLRRRRVA